MVAFASRTAHPRKAAGVGLNLAALRQLAFDAGFNGDHADVAAAVAMAESGGNPQAVGDNGTSFGLWQVHTPSHPEFDASRLLEPDYAAHAAYLISKGGADWSPWTTYRTGAYRRFMPGGGAA
jgi:hypothetical protein